MLGDWVRLGARLVRLLRDERHTGRHEAVLDRILEQARASADLRERRKTFAPTPTYLDLPITSRKNEVVQAIRKHQVIVLVGETGSGKTTQVPKMCLEAGLGIEAKIGCTQPRRVAALSISRRIAEELNLAWGQHVGCKIRFDDRSSPESYIKVMTDGILLAETQGDPLLSEYNAIIVDEAHERSLNIDFLLGYLKGLLAKRPELKLIITSATIETEAFSKAFDNAPIIEVSGRVYPVEIAYMPLDSGVEESGEVTYIDAAARCVEQVLCEPGDGDVLVFMPGERDIRETSDQIRTRCGDAADIIPLFGRLSSADQQKVFAPSSRRKVTVATNIAETSLTIPGIRYVIDPGLARISRYNPRTRIKRLPVEPVAQSSANQRKGRAGRVREGVCIRLYSEADFNERPKFTQPEIQRANLAEVILRMKAFRLGEIETFPFINPPTPSAIQAGYVLLQELGALDESRQLTDLGRSLARLPIDPTLGRMLLQAQQEHATRELLIIASGLSIQDPRERPAEQKEAAVTAHKRFAHPNSDFLTLLNIWEAVHDQWESLPSQNQRRKFCKANFLSYVRMREWQDLHAQLHGALEELGTVRLNQSSAAYEAIHRSILSGLLAHVAKREERNIYKGFGNRKLIMFPGSALYAREQTRPRERVRKQGKPPPAATDSSQPEWIMAGEIVETSQVFARTVAGIDPEWIVNLAKHLCKVAYANPHWSPEAGRVLAEEVISLHGLEVRRRRVAYGNINAEEATRIFIRSALVEERLFPAEPEEEEDDDKRKSKTRSRDVPVGSQRDTGTQKIPLFLERNQALRHKIETWQTRVRHHGLQDLDEALMRFYGARIQNVSSIYELNRFLAGYNDQEFLCATEQDLIGGQSLEYDRTSFPDQVAISGQAVPVSYAYDPGEPTDGVTFRIGFSLAKVVSPAALEWAVPGLREAQILELLKSLPKSVRRQLLPLQPKVHDILERFHPTGVSLREDLGKFILKHYGIEIPPSAWAQTALPDHLRPRVEIVADGGENPVATGRDLAALRKQIDKPKEAPRENPAWAEARMKWERFGLRNWSFGDLPERISIAPGVEGFPGLQIEDGQVNLKLFHALEAAARASREGVQRLVEIALEKDLAWLQKDLRAMVRFTPLVAGFCKVEDLQASGMANLKEYILDFDGLRELSQREFHRAVEQARSRLPALGPQLLDAVEPLLTLRQEVLRRCVTARPPVQKTRTLSDLSQLGAPAPPAANSGTWAIIRKELDALMPSDFLARVPFTRLKDFQRYLKALAIRADRAALNPLKDQERARQLAPYVEALTRLGESPPASVQARGLALQFRWLVEEYKVSLFAQELGTAVPVSPKRLDAHLEEIRRT
jgi:ATP-dependent helicase HrpA